MPTNLVFLYNKTSLSIHRGLLQSRVDALLHHLSLSDKTISIVFISDRDMAAYNEKYRRRNKPTNVLSFSAEKSIGAVPLAVTGNELGDILISIDTAEREARTDHKTVHERLTELIIHGLLHLQGFDHERSEEEALMMWDREKELFNYIKNTRRKTMTQLAINVDHVATVRQSRGINEPDPVIAAGICELAGASGIVVHLREDRRHIQDRDVRILRQTIKTKLNLEMAATKEIIRIALNIKPNMITLVPEKRRELTTEGGLDVAADENKIRKTIAKMTRAGIPVSLFIDPDARQIEASQEAGATFVELHTGRYCDATSEKKRNKEFQLIKKSAELAFESGLKVNAGHGLDYRTTARIATLETIDELSIGHAVISRAVYVGLDQAVREMLNLIKGKSPQAPHLHAIAPARIEGL